MARRTYSLTIEGGITPNALDIEDLARLLVYFRRAILAEAAHGGVPIHPKTTIPLVSISEGSVIPTLEFDRIYDPAVKRIEESIATGEHFRLSPRTRRYLHRGSSPLTDQGLSLKFNPGQRGQGPVISSSAPMTVPSKTHVRSPTTLYGKVQRVGGKVSPRGMLTLGDGRTVPVVLSVPLMKELGHEVWEDVGLEGDAVVDLETGAIVRFLAKRRNEYRRVGILQALDELAEAIGGEWDGAAADKYLAEVRKPE